ncbi:MAG: flippase-like domain-containing protein [Candidatus Omnitrophica bacterium]|nr:flippase-like domain-containing protein [Candidatus Omnitrophota bacterium]
MKKRLGFFFRLVVSLGALGGLIYILQEKLGESLQILRHDLQWNWFVLAVGVYFLALVLLAWRLQFVLQAQEVKVNLRQSFYLSFLGFFFNLFFPSALGGDIAKAYFAYQYSGKKVASLTGVILDRLLGFITLVLIALVALLVAHGQKITNPVVERSVYVAVGILIFSLFFFLSHDFAKKFKFLSFLIPSAKWREELKELYHAIRSFRNHKQALVMCLLISVAAQFLFFADGAFLAWSIRIPISIWPFFLLMPLVGFVSMAPSLSGLGVREAGFVFFFKPLMSVEQAFALSLLYDFILYGVSVIAGLIFAFRGGLKKEVMHDLRVVEELEEA